MAILIQSLSWTLIYSLAQGFMIYLSLWVLLKLVPAISANAKYHLSLSALTVLLGWFVATWWQQYHSIVLLHEQLQAMQAQHGAGQPPKIVLGALNSYVSYYPTLSAARKILPWLSVFYITGLAFMLARLSAGMLQLTSFRKKGLTQPDTEISELFTSLMDRLDVKGHVRLFVSAKAQVPMVIGYLKPMILMPAAAMAQLSMEQLETILLHELAHIKRHDYLVNILQTVAETILFFNPFAWMISRITRREREHCCDDLVVSHTLEPLYYATALATLAGQDATTPLLTLAASGEPDHLFNRIERIMEMKKNPFSYSRMVAAIVIIVSITCSTIWLTPSFATTKKAKPVKVAVVATEKNIQETKTASEPPQDNDTEENKLVKRMIGDGLLNQVKGFVLEKKDNKLYIDGQQQTDEVAQKYLPMVKQETIRVQVFSFTERLKLHPEASFIDVLLPVSFSSPCVEYKKPGC